MSGQNPLEILARPFENPQPLHLWPWLVLLSFTISSEIYYLLHWLVFYSLMAGNLYHHLGQLQLQSSTFPPPLQGEFGKLPEGYLALLLIPLKYTVFAISIIHSSARKSPHGNKYNSVHRSNTLPQVFNLIVLFTSTA